MTRDTLAFAKHPEAAGVERDAAEAHAEALTRHVLPDLVSNAYLDQRLEQLKHDLTVRVFGLVIGIVGVMNGILFALLRLAH
ncbi:MAG TPA: hypothetical protein VE993_20610 [Stellaceae bacterium]|nr:hypothetical protein [Stellaceae bacterium]